MASEGIDRAVRAADELRRRWKAGVRPGVVLFDLAGAHGVLVFTMAFDATLSGAFIRSRRRNRSVVLVNTNQKNIHHQRFTLAHELGHLELHEDQTGLVENVQEFSDDQPEHEANVFAAQFLVPLKELRRIIRTYGVTPREVSDHLVIDLARKFGVSHRTILSRLRILGGIPAEDIQQRIRDVDWNGLWKTYGPDLHAETIPRPPQMGWRPPGVSRRTAVQVSRLPTVYREMAFEAYRRGAITAGKLAEVLGLRDRQTVIEELRPILKPDFREPEGLEQALRELGRAKDGE